MVNNDSLNGGWIFASDLSASVSRDAGGLKTVLGFSDPSLIPSAMEHYMAVHSSSPDDPAHPSALRLMQYMCASADVTSPDALLQFRDYFAGHLEDVSMETGLQPMKDLAVSMRKAQSCGELLDLMMDQIDMQLAFWRDLREAEVLFRNLEVVCRFLSLHDDMELKALSLDVAEKLLQE